MNSPGIRPRDAVLLLCTCILCIGCKSARYADRGALFGGLTGAGVGAAIGEANGNAGAGAVLGSAVGAMTGAVVGQRIDDERAVERAAVEQEIGRTMSGAATIGDVIEMTQAGLGDEVIVGYVNNHGFQGHLAPPDLIFLKQQGVSDSVVRAMQRPRQAAGRPPGVVEPAPPPVVVYETRPWWRGPHLHYHHRVARRPGKFGWGFSFSN